MGITVGSWDAWADATGNLFVQRTVRSVVLSGGYEECKMDNAICAVKVDEARTGKDGKMKLKDEECTYGHKASQNAMHSGEAIHVNC
ncbi:hypothetical protein IW261DRAFT_1577232 [Armillaria novae-zelandiae]|uniref:Uncharacterized protein n=1 Tax=Armillaria novae-zelandiae TaxID=153914 RepID=A0AA39N8B7_9AGAR|nr:hypothetical protein IW261DRAFT_1577232 [Armillaria novae-zelandiae]